MSIPINITDILNLKCYSLTIPNRNDIVNTIDNRHSNTYNELCIRNYKVDGFILCMVDNKFLVQNIISEKKLL